MLEIEIFILLYFYFYVIYLTKTWKTIRKSNGKLLFGLETMAAVSHGSSPNEKTFGCRRGVFDDEWFVLDGDPDEPGLVGGDDRCNGDECEDLIVIREKVKANLLFSCGFLNWKWYKIIQILYHKASIFMKFELMNLWKLNMI